MSLISKILGKPLKTEEGGKERISSLRGVPILGLDAFSSAAYGPEAALTILIPLGAAGLEYMPRVMAAILVLLAILYFSYRQTIAAYPNGGGSYTVAKENLGERAGLVAAASLLLDYILNVAVGISAGIGALESAAPALQPHTLAACLIVLFLITMVNLRGIRDTGAAWMLPTYAFVASLVFVIGLGLWSTLQGGGHPAPVVAPPKLPSAIARVSFWLILRSFASGCTAMTGIEAVSNAVPIFAEPAAKKAQSTLGIISLLLGLLLAGIAFLARSYHLSAMTQDQPGYQSILAQLAAATLGHGFLYYVAIASVLIILILSANTSFTGFPRVCRLLAEDGYLPASFANLGRRLVYTYGIFILAIFAAILLIAFGGITDKLIPLFAIGAFGAFTLSQAGMVMHWRRQGRNLHSPSLLINGFGAATTGATLAIIFAAKFLEGAWMTALIIPLFIAIFVGVHRHYAYVKSQIAAPFDLQIGKVRPVKVIVPMRDWSRVADAAIRFALRISDDITAVHITQEKNNDELKNTWRTHIQEPARQAGFPEPCLQLIYSPYRQLYQPFHDFVDSTRRNHPDHLIAVIIPELVEPRWWEYLLHNHIATGLKAMLLLKGEERVIVFHTPWYLHNLKG